MSYHKPTSVRERYDSIDYDLYYQSINNHPYHPPETNNHQDFDKIDISYDKKNRPPASSNLSEQIEKEKYKQKHDENEIRNQKISRHINKEMKSIIQQLAMADEMAKKSTTSRANEDVLLRLVIIDKKINHLKNYMASCDWPKHALNPAYNKLNELQDKLNKKLSRSSSLEKINNNNSIVVHSIFKKLQNFSKNIYMKIKKKLLGNDIQVTKYSYKRSNFENRNPKPSATLTILEKIVDQNNEQSTMQHFHEETHSSCIYNIWESSSNQLKQNSTNNSKISEVLSPTPSVSRLRLQVADSNFSH